MLCTKGVIVHAISFDARPPAVVVEGPDGLTQVCPVKKWFADGDPPREVSSHLFADTVTIEVLGWNEQGEPAQARYDVKLQGIGDPVKRNADGSFGERSGQRLAGMTDRATRLPGVFDAEGMS